MKLFFQRCLHKLKFENLHVFLKVLFNRSKGKQTYIEAERNMRRNIIFLCGNKNAGRLPQYITVSIVRDNKGVLTKHTLSCMRTYYISTFPAVNVGMYLPIYYVYT